MTRLPCVAKERAGVFIACVRSAGGAVLDDHAL